MASLRSGLRNIVYSYKKTIFTAKSSPKHPVCNDVYQLFPKAWLPEEEIRQFNSIGIPSPTETHSYFNSLINNRTKQVSGESINWYYRRKTTDVTTDKSGKKDIEQMKDNPLTKYKTRLEAVKKLIRERKAKLEKQNPAEGKPEKL